MAETAAWRMGAKRKKDEPVRIVEDGVGEETEEVFNDIWEVAWLEAGHHAQSGCAIGPRRRCK